MLGGKLGLHMFCCNMFCCTHVLLQHVFAALMFCARGHCLRADNVTRPQSRCTPAVIVLAAAHGRTPGGTGPGHAPCGTSCYSDRPSRRVVESFHTHDADPDVWMQILTHGYGAAGDINASWLEGLNHQIVPTETQKNTCYAIALKTDFGCVVYYTVYRSPSAVTLPPSFFFASALSSHPPSLCLWLGSYSMVALFGCCCFLAVPISRWPFVPVPGPVPRLHIWCSRHC